MSTHGAPRYTHVSELEPAVAAAMLKWGLALADTKHRMGRRLSEWVNGAPALEAAVGAAAMTQDELGHARSLFAMLRDFPGAPADLVSETDLDRSEFFNPRFLDAPWASWMDVIAVNVLLDQALMLVFEAARGSQFGPLGQRAGKVLQEEEFHRVFGESWLLRLAKSNAAERLQASIDRAWPVALAWFGPDDDAVAGTLVKAGALKLSPSELREKWLARVCALLQKAGLHVPDAAVDWSKWDATRREVRDD
jgi:phenylacetate-CoA oxygenase PaaI subunit